MSAEVTNQQKLSMKRAGEGAKALRAEIKGLDALGDMLPALIAERAQYDSPPQTGRIDIPALITDAETRYPLQKAVDDKFSKAVSIRAKSLSTNRKEIFEMSPWSGTSAQEEKFKKAIDRVEHCASAISYRDGKKIIESALADAKDLIEQCIKFLEFEATRYPEMPVEPAMTKTTPTVEKTRSQEAIPFDQVFDPQIPTPVGPIKLGPLLKWVKGRMRKETKL